MMVANSISEMNGEAKIRLLMRAVFCVDLRALSHRQLLSDDFKDACAWHESDAHADFYVVSTLHQHFDRCSFPCINGNIGDANARPLSWYALLYQ